MNRINVGDVVRHFKGGRYLIIEFAEHTETHEKLVIYQAMYGETKVYARPFEMFMGKVDKEKYPNVLQEYRFENVDNILSAIDDSKEV